MGNSLVNNLAVLQRSILHEVLVFSGHTSHGLWYFITVFIKQRERLAAYPHKFVNQRLLAAENNAISGFLEKPVFEDDGP